MDNCRSCDAKLSPDIDWCPQCYTRTGPSQPGMPQAAPAPAQASASAVAGSIGAVTTAQNSRSEPLAPRELPVDALMHQFMNHQSRTKAGETSFGWMGRAMLSVGVFILGVIGYFVVIGNIGITPGWSSFEMYLPVFFTVGGAMLWGVWRPSRVDSRHR
jgi:hypothetical protein